MLNARHRVALLWQRLVAALSLVMAAALAPGAVTSPVSGAGAIGSRVGGGATVASAPGALATNVAALIEGGQLQPASLDTSGDGSKGKVCTVAVWQQLIPDHQEAAQPPRTVRGVQPTHAARSGDARAPPALNLLV
jgi:hypothetical protein